MNLTKFWFSGLSICTKTVYLGLISVSRNKNYINMLLQFRASFLDVQQGWQYATVRSEFAYYVPRTFNRTVPAYNFNRTFSSIFEAYRTRTKTKKAYHTNVPFFLAKIDAYRTYVTCRTGILAFKSEVESRTQGSRPRPRTQKKIRGQVQECSRPRPRTEDTGASILLKKKVFKNIFQAISNSLAYPKFLIKEGLNHKSHDITSSNFFQRGSFCGTKIS